METKMVAKLSMKNAGLSPRMVHSKEEGEPLTLCRIYGLAEGTKQVDDTVHGRTFMALVGRFQAVAPNGTVTRSGVLYLPSGIHDNYTSAMKDVPEGESLRFAIEIRAVKAENPAGYSYEVIDLLPPAEADPLNDIRKLAMSRLGDGTEKPPEPVTPAQGRPAEVVPAKAQARAGRAK
jgi:hypothetical protein